MAPKNGSAEFSDKSVIACRRKGSKAFTVYIFDHCCEIKVTKTKPSFIQVPQAQTLKYISIHQ